MTALGSASLYVVPLHAWEKITRLSLRCFSSGHGFSRDVSAWQRGLELSAPT